MKILEKIVDFLTSLRLTVVCLAMSLVLVFAGTIAQVNLGLYLVQERYFHSLFVFWTPSGTHLKIPVWPGGYLLGGLLLANLIAAHVQRFQFTKKKIGIFMVHFGLILLFLGQFMTDLFATESHLRLEEGQTKNYSESDRKSELVLVDVTDPQRDRIIAIPESRLRPGAELAVPDSPLKVRVKNYFKNSTTDAGAAGAVASPKTSEGFGARAQFFEAPIVVDPNLRNMPSAVIELAGPKGSLGSWFVSTMLSAPQQLVYDNRTYQLEMRFARFYKPYQIQLLHFSHEQYVGTVVPKNFASRIRLTRPTTGEDREVLIYMNNPLRYDGTTYYQAGFDDKKAGVTILQVVRNPSWLTPYLSVTLVGAGLVVQFMSHLFGFVKRRIA